MSKNIIAENRNPLESEGGNILINLIYISRVSNNISSETLNKILNEARINNQRHGVSGVLLFNANYFLQIIEGARPVINQLLTNLINDDRHQEIEVVHCGEINKREWGDWSMAYASPSKSNLPIFLKYSVSAEFNPYMMSTESIYRLLATISSKPIPSEES